MEVCTLPLAFFFNFAVYAVFWRQIWLNEWRWMKSVLNIQSEQYVSVEVPLFFLGTLQVKQIITRRDKSAERSKAEREQGALCHPEGHL